MQRYYSNRGQFSGLRSLIFMVLTLIVIFFVARFIFRILYVIAPFLLIATAIINHKILLNYFKNIGKLLQNNIGLGIAAAILSAIFYPVVAAFLFGQALLHRKVDKMQAEQKEGEYIEYEEVESEPIPEDFLEELNQQQKEKEEDLFDYWDFDDDNKEEQPPKNKLWD